MAGGRSVLAPPSQWARIGHAGNGPDVESSDDTRLANSSASWQRDSCPRPHRESTHGPANRILLSGARSPRRARSTNASSILRAGLSPATVPSGRTVPIRTWPAEHDTSAPRPSRSAWRGCTGSWGSDRGRSLAGGWPVTSGLIRWRYRERPDAGAPRLPHSGRVAQSYLVECYWPEVQPDSLGDRAARADVPPVAPLVVGGRVMSCSRPLLVDDSRRRSRSTGVARRVRGVATVEIVEQCRSARRHCSAIAPAGSPSKCALEICIGSCTEVCSHSCSHEDSPTRGLRRPAKAEEGGRVAIPAADDPGGREPPLVVR